MLFMDICSDLAPVIGILKAVVQVIQFGVPILLIIFGMLDLGKAVIAGKEDEMKKAQGTLIKRFIYAVAVFLVVTLVSFVMNLVGQGSGSAWYSCWSNTGAINTGTGAEG